MGDARCVMRNAGLALKTFGTKIEGLIRDSNSEAISHYLSSKCLKV